MNTQEKTYQAFIVCWDAVRDNVVSIASQLDKAAVNYLVLDSGTQTPDDERWLNIGDVRFYNQFHEAIKRFDTRQYDYFLFILGDAYFYSWEYFIDRCNFIFRNINVGAYAPHFDNSPWGVQQTKLYSLEVDTNLIVSTQTDGIVIALDPEIVGGSKNLFDRLVEKNLLPKMRGGWGVDYMWCVLSIMAGKLIIRDNSLVMRHPQGSSYDHGLAGQEMTVFLNEFLETVDKTRAGVLIEMIQSRMGGQNYGYDSFYNGVPMYKPKLDMPPYHIISVSDKRRHLVDSIKNVMHSESHQLKIPAVNAYTASNVEEFNTASNNLKIYPWISKGEFGCFASHYLFWKHVVDQNLQSAIVFEDDAVIKANYFRRFVPLAMREVPKDYDVFSIFVHHNQYERYKDSDQVNLVVAKAYQDWSTLCYMVSQKGARRLIQLADEYGMNEPVDWFIFRNGHRELLSTYTFRPHIPALMSIDTGAVPSILR
jgi:GR25 family glycosyltransferase involved in LPS biosynthesis